MPGVNVVLYDADLAATLSILAPIDRAVKFKVKIKSNVF
jgi:hypothetical protein